MPELSKPDAIRQAYLDPIRAVILIDDEFPRYDRFEATTPADPDTPATDTPPMPGNAAVAEEAKKPLLDYARARSLWSACRERGYLCEVDDGTGIGGTVPRHIEKSDLVILDYHLQGEDPSLALQVLKHLANRSRQPRRCLYARQEPSRRKEEGCFPSARGGPSGIIPFTRGSGTVGRNG